MSFIKNSFLIIIIGFVISGSYVQADISPDLLKGMKARSIGPAVTSGRMTALDVVTSNIKIMYAATATGGVWKSNDEGLTWKPIFDDQPVASIGSIAINQQNPDIVWVGTGEGNTRNTTSIGGGVFKSMDAGNTWVFMGLGESERINRIALHPTNPDIAYVAAGGKLWGPNNERGIYKTTDGGKTWNSILYVNEDTGATDIKIDPSNPHKLFAAMWQFRRTPYSFTSKGPGSGLYVSHDGGDNWNRFEEEDGMPKGDLGKMVVSISPSNPQKIYALVEAEKSALIVSSNGGESWETANDSPGIANRPYYYTEVLVDPNDENTLFNIDMMVNKSNNGGKNFEPVSAVSCCTEPNAIHVDNHTMWINPYNSDHMMLGSDGGIAISRDGGNNWRFVANLPISQFYHLGLDNDIPYNIYGGLQDNGSWRGPSEVWEPEGIRNHHWLEYSMGDGFDTASDPRNSNIGYTMSQFGGFSRFNLETGSIKLIKPQTNDVDVPLRFNWSAGFALSPHNPDVVYYGSQYIHKSTNRGDSWTTISDDLTTNDVEKRKRVEGMETMPHTTIISIAPSPLDENIIWVGTDDGRVHVTRDGGISWESIEARAKARGLNKGAWVPMIDPSPHDVGTAFIVMEDHRRSNMNPYLFRVEKFGKKWRNIINDDDVKGYALSVKQDHIDPDLIFLGTEFGLFYTLDGGKAWSKWTQGVPTVSVMDLAIQKREDDLVLGTHGRSFFVIDDYSGLRNLNEDDFEGGLKFLSASKGVQYTVRRSPSTRFTGNGEYQGENQPYGSAITFLAKLDDKPQKATIEISNGMGEIVRTFKTGIHEGINRVNWSLRYDGNAEPRKPGAPKTEDLPEGRYAIPGTYKASIKYDGEVVSGEITVIPDPKLTLSQNDWATTANFLDHMFALRKVATKAMERIAFAKHDLELIQKMIKDALPSDAQDDNPLKVSEVKTKEILEGLDEIEKYFLIQGLADDQSKHVTAHISSAMSYAGYGGKGNFADSTFTKVTDNAKKAATIAEISLKQALSDLNGFFEEDLADFKASIAGLNLEYLKSNNPLQIPTRD